MRRVMTGVVFVLGYSLTLPALAKEKGLQQAAERALGFKPVTVTAKKVSPPSGDKHDYMSVAPYWWPDPRELDGLPYIRRDGKRNPATRNRDSSDAPRFSQLCSAVSDLTAGYRAGGDERYAKHAARLLKTWFIDADTRMNPNLNFAQAVPGRSEGRCFGIIELRAIVDLIDAVKMITNSDA
ncbi:MAG: hypothetical protein ACI9UA_000851 [Pseudoalteromonas tetraodonis]|jgi:hypothetical protein